MTEPKRIQLRRTKGWRKPEGAVVVARPSKWGNPWKVGEVVEHANPYYRKLAGEQPIDAAMAVELYRAWITPRWLATDDPELVSMLGPDLAVAELRGKDLCCWCPEGQPCHADVLLDLANREGP